MLCVNPPVFTKSLKTWKIASYVLSFIQHSTSDAVLCFAAGLLYFKVTIVLSVQVDKLLKTCVYTQLGLYCAQLRRFVYTLHVYTTKAETIT